MKKISNGFVIEQDLLRWRKLALKIHEHQIEEAWRRMTDAGFKPLLIKGWSAALYYDEPVERGFNDLDLALAPVEYGRAEAFLRTITQNLTIDLHSGLKHLDTQPFERLYANSQTVRCGKTDVRVLCREDHLRVLCVHWLVDGGAKKDKLQDIYYAVKNRPVDFDWDKCLSVVSPVRRRWIVCTIGLAHKYLGLDVSGTPFAESIEQLPEWLLKALEKEWQSDTVIVPLHLLIRDPKNFWKQIKKRMPPNPIQATVEMEGSFDDGRQIFYQIGNILQRLMPSVKRILNNGRQRGK